MTTQHFQGVISMPVETVVEALTRDGVVLATRPAGAVVRGCCGGTAPWLRVNPQAGGDPVIATGWRPAS